MGQRNSPVLMRYWAKATRTRRENQRGRSYIAVGLQLEAAAACHHFLQNRSIAVIAAYSVGYWDATAAARSPHAY
jgi:hypothetical protein